MAHSFTDLAGLKLSAEAFFAAVLEKVAQPLWVVDAEGRIRFANPAAVGALGHDSAEELLGRDSHETIRYRHPDRTPGSAADWPMLLPRATGETVAGELDWFVRRDGSKFPVSYVSVPIDMPEGRGVVVASPTPAIASAGSGGGASTRRCSRRNGASRRSWPEGRRRPTCSPRSPKRSAT